MSFVRKFQKGDTVFHRPTGETWSLIKDEQDGWVTPGGWPPSQGRAEDCKPVEAEPESDRTEFPAAQWCAACGKWTDHGSGTCPTITH